MDSTGPLASSSRRPTRIAPPRSSCSGPTRAACATRTTRGQRADEWDAHDREVEERWGQPDYVEEFLEYLGPTMRRDPESIARWTTYYRQAASPGMAMALNRMERETDVRPVLRSVQAPTLVMHRKDEGVPIEEGRYLAGHIPGAHLVELEGADHLPGDGDLATGDRRIGRFLGSVRDEEASFDRVLASVLSRTSWIDGEGGRARRPALARDRRGPPRDGSRHPREVSRGRDRHRGRLLRDLRRARLCGALRAGDRRCRPAPRARGPPGSTRARWRASTGRPAASP